MVDKQMGEPPCDPISTATAPLRKSLEEEFTPADSGTFTLASVLLHPVVILCVCKCVCSCVYASRYSCVCVCTRECAFVFAYGCVYICGVCACGGQRLTFGVGDSLSFYLLRRGSHNEP